MWPWRPANEKWKQDIKKQSSQTTILPSQLRYKQNIASSNSTYLTEKANYIWILSILHSVYRMQEQYIKDTTAKQQDMPVSKQTSEICQFNPTSFF